LRRELNAVNALIETSRAGVTEMGTRVQERLRVELQRDPSRVATAKKKALRMRNDIQQRAMQLFRLCSTPDNRREFPDVARRFDHFVSHDDARIHVSLRLLTMQMMQIHLESLLETL
jgi:hypothetical protein